MKPLDGGKAENCDVCLNQGDSRLHSMRPHLSRNTIWALLVGILLNSLMLSGGFLNSSGRLPIHGDLLEAEDCPGYPVFVSRGGYVI